MESMDWQALRERMQKSKSDLNQSLSGESVGNTEPEKVISTSKGESEKPFHQPIPTNETENAPQLKPTPDYINKMRGEYHKPPNSQVSEGDNDSYRNYLEQQPEPGTQNNGEGQNLQQNNQEEISPNWRSKLDELKNGSSEQQNSPSPLNTQNQEAIRDKYSSPPTASDTSATSLDTENTGESTLPSEGSNGDSNNGDTDGGGDM